MRTALLAVSALWPIVASGQQIDQSTAQMIMGDQQSQVPGGECASSSPCQSQGLVPITFQGGDVVLSGSITDSTGNVWSLAPDSCNGNSPSNWWSGLSLNGQQQWCGYGVALRNINGQVWYEEAKGSGWKNLTAEVAGGALTGAMTGPYVANPGQGSGGATSSAPIVSGSAADTTVPSDPASLTSTGGQSCPSMTLPGAVTPNNGTFTANGNTYSIDATDGDVASVNGAPINQGAYETSQLVQGSDGAIYGQSNAAANNGQWFTLQGTGSDTWWQPASAPPAAAADGSVTTASTSTDTTAQNRVAPTVCPQIASIQAQISAANQQMQQLMAQQAQLMAQQQMAQPSAPTVAPAPPDSTSGGGSEGGDGGGGEAQ